MYLYLNVFFLIDIDYTRDFLWNVDKSFYLFWTVFDQLKILIVRCKNANFIEVISLGKFPPKAIQEYLNFFLEFEKQLYLSNLAQEPHPTI